MASDEFVPTFDVVIVGAGHGGAQTAISLRQQKFSGTIAIVGDEPDMPYERPPLSKDYLSREKPFERILIRPVSFWKEREVEMLLGRRIVAVEPAARLIRTSDGTAIGYEHLVWATGGIARALPCSGYDLAGVHTVRTRADADQLIAEIDGVSRVVVIGGGYIGLEAAAVLVKLGKQVILLEALDRVLARVAGASLSQFYEAEHRARGVELRTSATVRALRGDETGNVTCVELADGDLLECEMVIVGIGIVPAVQPLLSAGAIGGDGVAVDPQCRTSLPNIFAIGDCALHSNRFADGKQIRVESVQNANDQANVVAKVLTGRDANYDSVPWFWSNQYDLRLQTVGLSIGYDACVQRGDGRSFSVIYLREGRVIALDCVNATRDYVQGRALVLAGKIIDLEKLSDTTVPLKELASAL